MWFETSTKFVWYFRTCWCIWLRSQGPWVSFGWLTDQIWTWKMAEAADFWCLVSFFAFAMGVTRSRRAIGGRRRSFLRVREARNAFTKVEDQCASRTRVGRRVREEEWGLGWTSRIGLRVREWGVAFVKAWDPRSSHSREDPRVREDESLGSTFLCFANARQGLRSRRRNHWTECFLFSIFTDLELGETIFRRFSRKTSGSVFLIQFWLTYPNLW